MQEANKEELRQRDGQKISPGAFHLYILSEGAEQEHFQGPQRPSLLPAMLYQTVRLVRDGMVLLFGRTSTLLALHINRNS